MTSPTWWPRMGQRVGYRAAWTPGARYYGHVVGLHIGLDDDCRDRVQVRVTGSTHGGHDTLVDRDVWVRLPSVEALD